MARLDELESRVLALLKAGIDRRDLTELLGVEAARIEAALRALTESGVRLPSRGSTRWEG
jgi:helix-turn-helix protein